MLRRAGVAVNDTIVGSGLVQGTVTLAVAVPSSPVAVKLKTVSTAMETGALPLAGKPVPTPGIETDVQFCVVHANVTGVVPLAVDGVAVKVITAGGNKGTSITSCVRPWVKSKYWSPGVTSCKPNFKVPVRRTL